MELERGAKIPPEKGEKGAGEAAAGAGEARVEVKKTQPDFAGQEIKDPRSGEKEGKHAEKPEKKVIPPLSGRTVIPQGR